jgi:hypothetical protein
MWISAAKKVTFALREKITCKCLVSSSIRFQETSSLPIEKNSLRISILHGGDIVGARLNFWEQWEFGDGQLETWANQNGTVKYIWQSFTGNGELKVPIRKGSGHIICHARSANRVSYMGGLGYVSYHSVTVCKVPTTPAEYKIALCGCNREESLSYWNKIWIIANSRPFTNNTEQYELVYLISGRRQVI